VARASSGPEIHNWYGGFLLDTGYLQAGWAERQRAGELDPLSPLIAWHVGYAALIKGRPDVVEAYTEKARENGWEGPEPIALEGGGASERGDFDRAERLWIKAFPHRAEQIQMSVKAIKSRHVDAETAKMLATLAPYGPPGIGRFAVQGMSRDVDGSLATIQGTLDPASLRKADGSGGPVRSRGGDGSAAFFGRTGGCRSRQQRAGIRGSRQSCAISGSSSSGGNSAGRTSANRWKTACNVSDLELRPPGSATNSRAIPRRAPGL
jgi:hypothetical protein